MPGGGFLVDVAKSAWKKYREKKKDAEIRAEIQQLAEASFEEARKAGAEAAREAVANGPIEDRIVLELYLSQVPGAVRNSLKRPEDATGKTVPRNFALRTPHDMLRLLPQHPMRFKPGDALLGMPGWSLMHSLGSGGFGEVWLARNSRNMTERGAVKFCHPEHVRDLVHERDVIQRVREAGKHNNIVQLKHAYLTGNTPWLMYEYIAGGDLANLIRQWQVLDTQERVNRGIAALYQLCDAVAHFHKLRPPIVHRDLKPDNILVDEASRRLLVTDFGIGAVTAKAVAEVGDGTTTRFGKLPESLAQAHTPLYSSPQQRGGAAPDPRDDVYALGVIAYQLVTGQLTHGPGTDFGDDLREAGANDALIELIGECVAQKPERRPTDAVEFLHRVQTLIRVPSSSAPSRSAVSGAKPKPPPVPIPPALGHAVGVPTLAPSPVPPPVPSSERRPRDRDDERLPRQRRSGNALSHAVPVWGWLVICLGGLFLCCSVPMGLGLFGNRGGPTQPDAKAKSDPQMQDSNTKPPTVTFNPNSSEESVGWFAEQQYRIKNHHGNDYAQTRKELIAEVCSLPVGKSINWTVSVSKVSKDGLVSVTMPYWSPRRDAPVARVVLHWEGKTAVSPWTGWTDSGPFPWGGDASSLRALREESRVQLTGVIGQVMWSDATGNWAVGVSKPMVWPERRPAK